MSESVADRVALAAHIYLKAEVDNARAQNALNAEQHLGEAREQLAEVAWETGRARNVARDTLMVVLSTWRTINGR